MSALARAAITGVGMSDIGRSTNRPAILHLAEAADRDLDGRRLALHAEQQRVAHGRPAPARRALASCMAWR